MRTYWPDLKAAVVCFHKLDDFKGYWNHLWTRWKTYILTFFHACYYGSSVNLAGVAGCTNKGVGFSVLVSDFHELVEEYIKPGASINEAAQTRMK